MLFSEQTTYACLVEQLALSGAPGASVLGPDGAVYNPVHELAKGLAFAFSTSTTAALAATRWVTPPPVPVPGTFPIAPGAPAHMYLSDVETVALATAAATACGWTGPARSVLFLGALRGLRAAADRAPKLLTSSDPLLATAPLGMVMQLLPFPLVEGALVSQMTARWSTSGFFAGGDASRRLVVAQRWASLAATAWSRVRPMVVVPGILGGAPSPVGYSLQLVGV